MNKKDRDIVFNKYAGRCAYCGCELTKGWHVDHFHPVVRELKYNVEKGRIVTTGNFHRPENNNKENYMPSCPPCNIQKGSSDIDGFRFFIQNTINSMGKRFTQYKFAKKFGLIQETGVLVKFYFENIDVR